MAGPYKKEFIMKKISILAICFFVASSMSTAHASTIETFDTKASATELLNFDVFTGDNNTRYGFARSEDIFFNGFNTSNSISLKDTSLVILNFDYYERASSNIEDIGLTWAWTFYDVLGNIAGSRKYTTTGVGTVLNMDLIAEGLTGVTSIQLSHPDGHMYIDNLEYDVSAVPVPAALFLFAPALLGFMGFRRKAVDIAAA